LILLGGRDVEGDEDGGAAVGWEHGYWVGDTGQQWTNAKGGKERTRCMLTFKRNDATSTRRRWDKLNGDSSVGEMSAISG
jgi:hypothetical protein